MHVVDPVSTNSVSRVGPPVPGTPARRPDEAGPERGFAATLRQQLEQVSRMQTEADAGLERLLTGQTQNMTEVFAAARKAEVAFGLLMEIRNKLADAYLELKRMQV